MQQTAPRQTLSRDPIVGGLVLIIVGTVLLAGTAVPDLGRFVVPVIGLMLLAAFAVTRTYAMLVPGAIVTGIGAGILATQSFPGETGGGVFLVSLGIGFLGILALGALARVPENHWWPIVPGMTLATLGVIVIVGGPAFDLLWLWPVALVAAGTFLVVETLVRNDRTEDAGAAHPVGR